MLTEYLAYLAYIPVLAACFNVGPFNILTMLASIFGYECYTLNFDYNREEMYSILKNIKDHVYSTEKTIRNGTITPRGYFISKDYLGHFDGYRIWIYIKKEFFPVLSQVACVNYIHTDAAEKDVEEINKMEDCNEIMIFDFNHSYKHPSFYERRVNLSYIVPTLHQEPVLDAIYKQFKKRGRASIWIDGCPGSGKSTIGLLLAKKLCGNYCHSFQPTTPSVSCSILNDGMIDRDDAKPLVVVVEEYDKIIQAVHHQTVPKNELYSIMVHDKASLNTFVDDLYLYPNTVFLFTSNTKKSEIDLLDPSYLRRGRMHAYFTLDTEYCFGDWWKGVAYLGEDSWSV